MFEKMEVITPKWFQTQFQKWRIFTHLGFPCKKLVTGLP